MPLHINGRHENRMKILPNQMEDVTLHGEPNHAAI
jgi:hypothetical protein